LSVLIFPFGFSGCILFKIPTVLSRKLAHTHAHSGEWVRRGTEGKKWAVR